ncbi:hypothetical protein ACLMJK_009543 [Lecanora helva]
MLEPGTYVLAKPGEKHHGLHRAPLRNLTNPRVLDIGTGTGTWAIEFANQHPDSHVLGTDINPPELKSVPQNCTFAAADAEHDWTFAQEPFDYIHGRMLVLSIRDWPRLIQRCRQHLQPGGWLELNDVAVRFFAEDGCGEAEAPMLKWVRTVFQASARNNGIDVDATYKHAQQLRDAGFVDVREGVFTWPVGSGRARTADEAAIGEMQVQNMQALVGNVTETVVRKGGLLGEITAEQARKLAEEARRDVVENADVHGYYMHLATFIGQAPW